MGLDTSHDCWHGAYSAFSRWRDKLAEVAGYTFADYETEFGSRSFVVLDWDSFTDENYLGEWAEAPKDPLLVLLVHSDYHGVIKPVQAQPLADRLTELLPLLPDEDNGGHIGHWREKTQYFIDGLRAAVAAGEDVRFQ